jgi:hypothetical protein
VLLVLALQYIPSGAEPVTVHASTDPQLIQHFRQAVLDDAHVRAASAGDDVVALIEEAEESRLRQVLDALLGEGRA